MFHTGCFLSIQSVLENGLIPGGHESEKGRQTVFFAPLNPLGGFSDEEKPRDDYSSSNVHHHSNWKRNQDAVYWVELSRALGRELQFWKTNSHAITVHSPVPAKLHPQSNLSKRRSNTVRKTLNPHDPRQRSH